MGIGHALALVEDPVPWHDFHATVLNMTGLDHERLTDYHDGIGRRLTNVVESAERLRADTGLYHLKRQGEARV